MSHKSYKDIFSNFKKKRFLFEVSYVAFGSLVNGGSLFLINVLLGRALSHELYGIFSLSVLLLSTVAEISDLGLNAGLLRFVPYYLASQEAHKLNQVLKTIWHWRVALSFILTAGGIIGADPIARYILGQPSIAREVAFTFLGVGGVILLGFLTTYLQAIQRFAHTALLQSVKGLFRLVMISLLLVVPVHSMYALIAVYIFVPWILFATNFHFLPKQFWRTEIAADEKRSLHQQLRNFSVWLTFWSILSIISSRLDQVMISHLLGLEQVAIYTAAYQLIQFFPIIAQSISSVFTPKVNRARTKKELLEVVKRSSGWIIGAVFILGIFIYPSQFLIRLFFGSSYEAAMPVYVVLAASLAANLLVIPFSAIIYAFNRTQYMTVSGALQLFINFFGNLYFIPRFGVLGAAYTFALGIGLALLYNIACSLYLLRQKEITVA